MKKARGSRLGLQTMTWVTSVRRNPLPGAGVDARDTLQRLGARAAPLGVAGGVAVGPRVHQSTGDFGPLAGAGVLERRGRAVGFGLHRDVRFAVAVLVGERDGAAALRLDDGGV